jgi:L-malate glycosyltransferase
MLNILIFSDEFPPAKGGCSSVASQYAELLSDIGHKITVLTRIDNKIYKQHSQYMQYRIKYTYQLGISILSHLFNVNLYKNYDAIILNDTASIYIAGLIFSKVKLKKSVCIIHGSELEYVYHQPSKIKSLFQFGIFFSRTVKQCKKIVCVSNYLKTKVVHFYLKKGIDVKNKCETVYAGVRRSAFYCKHIQSNIFPKEFENGIKLISVSRIVKKKGYEKMLDLFELLNLASDKYFWIVVGNGNYLDTLKQEAKKRKLLDCILFTGELDRQSIRDYYIESNLFWLLSEHDEGFGLTWLEAQMCGLPAIGLNKGAIKENINPNFGLVAEQKEDVFKFIKEKSYLTANKAELATSVQYLSSENQILKLNKILRNINEE